MLPASFSAFICQYKLVLCIVALTKKKLYIFFFLKRNESDEEINRHRLAKLSQHLYFDDQKNSTWLARRLRQAMAKL